MLVSEIPATNGETFNTINIFTRKKKADSWTLTAFSAHQKLPLKCGEMWFYKG
jgi:hypothetical protein